VYTFPSFIKDANCIYKCAIPVFEGLLPKKHDKTVRKLLFELSTWHGLGKLRLHTEPTVMSHGTSTTRLGEIIRDFSETVCLAYATYELPSEEAARVRRKATAAKNAKAQSPKKKKKKSTTKSEGVGPTSILKSTGSSRRVRSFNLVTYKLHALGWYPRAIRLYGTSDNYNTQTVRLLSLSNLKAGCVCC
jgi:hypothetical protein